MSPAEQFARLPESERAAFIDRLSDDEAALLLYDWRGFLARPDQIEPEGDWDIWLALAGRGWGKTRTGAEWVKEKVGSGKYGRIALVAETAQDGREVMVEGDSGLLAIYPKSERPTYQSSRRRLTWPNGAVASIYNATEPGQLRGPQHDLAWSDEIAKWRHGRATWDQLQFGLRLGDNPRQIVTTTPRPLELIKSILAGKEGVVHVTRGKTINNKSNLAVKFLEKVIARYEGTRLGRQELNAEVLGDLPGALWTLDTIDAYRLPEPPDDIQRVCVAVDPAVTNTEESNEHGIVVCGSNGNQGYVLDDGSRSGTPNEWAKRAISLHDKWEADCIIAEVNNGGDMIANTIKTLRPNIKVVEVRATRGKHVRAEPVSALYDQGRVNHIGTFTDLEDQMVLMTSSGWEGESGSPDRLDALVWGLTHLFPSITRKIEVKPIAPTPRVNKPMAQRRRR